MRAQTDVANREEMIKQETAMLGTSRYNLSQVTLLSPFDGIVTAATSGRARTSSSAR